MQSSPVVYIAAVVLSLAVALYFRIAGLPLDGRAVLVVGLFSLIVVWLAKRAFIQVRKQSGKQE